MTDLQGFDLAGSGRSLSRIRYRRQSAARVGFGTAVSTIRSVNSVTKALVSASGEFAEPAAGLQHHAARGKVEPSASQSVMLNVGASGLCLIQPCSASGPMKAATL